MAQEGRKIKYHGKKKAGPRPCAGGLPVIKAILAAFVFIHFSAGTACAEDSKALYMPGEISRAELVRRIRMIKDGEKSARFTRMAPGILKIEGFLGRGSFDEYMEHIDESVKALVVNSPGGSAKDAVQIGLDVLDRDLTVIVEGIAASEAANFLFLAGSRKVIRAGFVAFAGNATSFVASEGWEGVRKKVFEENKELLEEEETDIYDPFITLDIVEGIYRSAREELEEIMELEKKFLEKINLSQDFFETTRPEKMNPGNGRFRGFVIPACETFIEWGIPGVEGASDVSMARELGVNFIQR